jgi:hypothetical protein
MIGPYPFLALPLVCLSHLITFEQTNAHESSYKHMLLEATENV